MSGGNHIHHLVNFKELNIYVILYILQEETLTKFLVLLIVETLPAKKKGNF
jgi:hypothetical protein